MSPELRAAPVDAANAPRISREEKDRLLRENRARLDRDLLESRLVFESMPRHVDLQLSNLCNMSCIMCYDGWNPPTQKLPEALVEAFAKEVLPTASTLAPFVASEPLIYTWEHALGLAERYAVQLEIITNAQFLDEKKLAQLEPHVTTLSFSIDSHMPDVYERIRIRSQPDKVFANLPRAAKWCNERGIEPIVNVVFMIENAAFMDETVAAFAGMGCTTVRVLMLLTNHLDPVRQYSDALRHLSPQWIDWMLGKMRRVAEEKKIQLIWAGPHQERHDFRPAGIQRRRPVTYSIWDELRYFFPGYCVQSVDHVKVHVNGDVYPCCVAEKGQLLLGNLEKQSFREVWNGPEARDLRRAMLTHDLPEICKGCHFHTALVHDEHAHLPVVDWFHDVHCGGTVPRVPEERRALKVLGPAHMARHAGPPVFAWEAPEQPVDEYCLVLGVGGTFHEDNQVFVVPGDRTEFRPTAEQWAALRPNLGYWWSLWGLRKSALGESLRAPTVRCVVRHQDIPRVAGSKLYG